MLIICCSPEEAQSQETLSTLKFGECAKRVTTFASANVVAAPDEVAAQLAELRAEVVRLKRQVRLTSPTTGCHAYGGRRRFGGDESSKIGLYTQRALLHLGFRAQRQA